MTTLVILILLGLLLFGVGFSIHLLWIVAVIVMGIALFNHLSGRRLG